MLNLIIIAIIAYLAGSFNAAYWLAKWFADIDIRQHGSKNAGATNLLRVKGWKFALPAFIIDVGKSFGAAQLVIFQDLWLPQSEGFMICKISLGIVAVLGHVFPLYTGFRGGKGVASLLGLVFAVHPIAALSAMGVFIIILLTTRIVSLSSILAGLSFPLLLFFIFNENSISLLIFSLISALLILITHKINLKRLLSGEEKQIKFK